MSRSRNDKTKISDTYTMKELGFSTKATVSRIIDGDTIEFEIKRTFRGRIKDFLAPEKSAIEGKVASQKLKDILPIGSEMIVFIPTNDSLKLMDLNSFDRILVIPYDLNWNDIRPVLVDKGIGRMLLHGEKPHTGI